jgi:HSP20 family protein
MQLTPWRRQDLWNPFGDLEDIQREMNQLFDFSFSHRNRPFSLLESGWAPAVDVYDTKENFLVKADLPGMTKDDIEVSVDGNLLHIKGEKKEEHNAKDKNYVRTERFYGSFQRSVELPTEVDPKSVTAVYKNGVLELTIPKKEEAKPKQINIEVK